MMGWDRKKLRSLRAMTPIWAAGLALGLLLSSGPLLADPVSGEATVTTDGGYARLLIKLDEEVDAKVTTSGTVLIISFKKPVSVPVERINARAPDYISAARLDPDGSAIRIALAKKVKVSTIPAAERLYVDLLPDNWVGLAPGLPQQVIDELSRRAQEAERQLRKQQAAAHPKFDGTIRVKVGVQPTFVRYIFTLPDTADVVPERGPGKLTLRFDQPIKFDLADVATTQPESIEGVDSNRDRDSATVVFRLNGQPVVRSYRDGQSLVVDVSVSKSGKQSAVPKQQEVAPAVAANAAAKKPPAIEQPASVVADNATSPAGQPRKIDPVADDAKPKPPAPSTELAAAAPLETKAPAAPALKDARAAPAAVPATKPETPAPVAAQPVSPAKKEAAAEPAPAAPPIPPDMMSPGKVPSKPDKAEGPPPPPPLPADVNAPVTAALHRQGDNLRIDFPFATPTPAALFRRGRTLWAVFDTGAKINAAALKDDKLFRSTSLESGKDGEAILRIGLNEPKLVSFYSEGSGWVLTIGDSIVEPTKPVSIARSIVGKGRASITIPFIEPRKLHRIADPEVGDALLVVTALGPARGFLKDQEFVELRALASTHGVVVQPLADDVTAELAADKIVISRPGGLSLSSSSIATRDNTANTNADFQPLVFDTQTWGFDRQANFEERQSDLIGRAAAAPEAKRRAARFDLARFYLAREMGAEAKGVLDVATADERDASVTGMVLKAVANVMLNRPDDALKELSDPKIGNNSDAPIWRAMAHAYQGQWARAREEFKKVEVSMGALPVELQRTTKREYLRCSVEVRDFAGASTLLNDFETLGVPPPMAPSMQVLTGRVEEGLGRTADALAAYRMAAASHDRRYAAQGQLRDIALRQKLGDLKPADVIGQLEELTTAWRGDETEAEGLQMLAHLYTQDKRARDAFHVMRTALLAHPNSDLTRKIQEEAAKTFDSLFLGDEGDAMPAIEALGLFYDYRDLTPIGRRGDDMIRKLADRLVAVDLLDQAAELLQHQIDHRLQGAARAQVATKLATVYLMNQKPDLALAAIQKTRMSDIAGDLRDQRLLLESRALSELGRHEMALEIVEQMKSKEAQRLRADILWSAKKWREAGEAIEVLYGDRYKKFAPLTDQERADVLRGAIAYSLAEDPMSLARFREKYAAKMVDGPDRRAFEVVASPIGSSSKEFREVANTVGNTSTLDAFLREMKKRYPDKDVAGMPGASPPQTKPAKDTQANNAPAKPDDKPDDKPKGKAAEKSDASPTGSILPARKKRPR
jgi:tetratricopeptide (TPR) repeat protein